MSREEVTLLDGVSLTPAVLYRLGQDLHSQIGLTEAAWEGIDRARRTVDDVLDQGLVAYGINTGFGEFSRVIIPPADLQTLQRNLILSHAAGTGPPLPVARARMLFALRINVLAKGHSGIRRVTVERLCAVFNSGCVSWVPRQGTVGASGDLAPLSHLALGCLGEGRMWDPDVCDWLPAKQALDNHGLVPIELEAKEGLALINGTQFISALGSEALVRARRLAVQADIIAAMTLEVLKGTVVAFDPAPHSVRPHVGQQLVAARLRSVLHREGHTSAIYMDHRDCGSIQDAYTLRCVPQVHGVTNDTIDFVERLLLTELNSATDNPLVFPDTGRIVSAGNFHGEYPAKACDYLAIGVHELASISERRIERMVNPALSSLPPFLVRQGGLNSGFMIAHCTAASLVSENKVLCHPSSIDSLSTSAAKEDHVSMGGMAARKVINIVENVCNVLAIELMCACAGLDFALDRGTATTPALMAVHRMVREVVPPYDKDRYMSPDIEACADLVASGRVWEAVRSVSEPYLASQGFPVPEI